MKVGASVEKYLSIIIPIQLLGFTRWVVGAELIAVVLANRSARYGLG